MMSMGRVTASMTRHRETMVGEKACFLSAHNCRHQVCPALNGVSLLRAKR